MAVEVLEIGPCKKLLKANFSQARVQTELKKSYTEVRRNVSIKGFRKGKIPQKLIEKRYGESIREELTTTLIREALVEGIDGHKLDIIGDPKIESPTLDPTQDPAFTFEATVQVRPDFDVPSFDDLRIVRDTVEATDDDVAESLEASRKARGTLEAKDDDDATVEAGDSIVCDLEFVANGEAVNDLPGTTLNADEMHFGDIDLPDLPAKLLGAKAGDVVEVACTFPEALGFEEGDHTFRVKVNAIKTMVLPTLDDAFAEEAGFDSVDELREEIRAQMLRRRTERADSKVDEDILEALLSRTDFPVPGDLIEKELDELALRAIMTARYRGIDDETAKAEGGKIREASRPDVERRLKGLFLIDKIAAEHEIQGNEADLDMRIQAIAAQRGQSFEEVFEKVESEGVMGRLLYDIRIEKTRAFLREQAEIIDAENR